MINSEKYNVAWEQLKKIDSELGDKIVSGLQDISPELGRLIIEYGFGDIYSRPGLSMKEKEIAVVAALTALGTAPSQLKIHLNGALHTGCTVSEIKEVILQMAVYAGFPRCVNGMFALKEIIQERRAAGKQDATGAEATEYAGVEDRLQRGTKELNELDNTQLEKLEENFGELAPELVQFTLEFGYADIFSRDNLDKKYRQIATIAALTVMGNALPQLKFHIGAALSIGLSADTIKEIMLLMTIYAGFPAAINGTYALKQVLEEEL